MSGSIENKQQSNDSKENNTVTLYTGTSSLTPRRRKSGVVIPLNDSSEETPLFPTTLKLLPSREKFSPPSREVSLSLETDSPSRRGREISPRRERVSLLRRGRETSVSRGRETSPR